MAAVLLVAPADAGADVTDGPITNIVSVQPDRPVTHSPVRLFLGITNNSDTTVNSVTVQATLPPEAVATLESGNCTTAGTLVTCEFSSLGPRTNTGFFYLLEFDTEGTYQVSSTVTSTGPVSQSTNVLDIVVEPENADLAGLDDTAETLTGETVRVFNQFRNLGPTGSGQASISGTAPSGTTIVPGSFFFGYGTNTADTTCTVATTTYTCAPVTAEYFDGFTGAVAYDVVVPSVPGTIAATATIAGRNDPNPANNTSTYTIDVGAPAAELLVDLTAPTGTIEAGVPAAVTGRVQNVGVIAAANVVLTMTAPSDWTASVQSVEPAEGSCVVQPSGHEIRCTLPTFDRFSTPLSVNALLTPPANASGVGKVDVSATSDTPEFGTYPNDATVDLPYRTFGVPSLTVTPASGLVDGQVVRVEASGFVAGPLHGVLMCEAAATTSSQCDFSTVQLIGIASDGTASADYAVQRVIDTPAGGFRDCAIESCTVTLGNIDETRVANAPVTFANTPVARLALIGDPQLAAIGAPGSATVRAELQCDVELKGLVVHFTLEQPGAAPVAGASNVTVDCVPGTPVSVFSDFMAGFGVGAAEASVSAVGTVAADSGPVTVRSFADAKALLDAGLAGPDAAIVLQELIDGLVFRIGHNPIFRRAFAIAIFFPGSQPGILAGAL